MSDNKKFQAIFEGVLDAILLTDDDGVYVDANPAACELLGYTREELIGLSISDITPHENLSIQDDAWDELERTGTYMGEYHLRHKDGHTFAVEFRAQTNIIPDIHLAIFRDVTERKRAENALRQSEARYRALFDGSVNPIVVYDEEARFVMLNDVAARGLGLPNEEIIGTRIGDYIPESQDITVERVQKALTTSEVQSVQDKIVLYGENRWYWTNIQPLPSVDDQDTHWVLMNSYDITQQKRAENALHESEERYRALFDGVRNPIAVYDEDARIIMINEAGARNLGDSVDNLTGKNIGEFLPEFHDITVERARQVLDTNTPMIVQDEMHLDGEIISFWTSIQPLYETSLGKRLAQFISYDITEQKQAEEALRQSEEVYESLYKTVPIALFRTTPEGKLLNANEAMVSMFGYPDLATFLTISVINLYADPADRAPFISGATNTDWVTTNLRLKRYDGTPFDCEVNMRTFRNDAGETIYFEGSLQDITERNHAKQAEAERLKLTLQLEKEREVAELKASLLSILAHEFRTPLSVILSSSELISHYGDRLSDAQKQGKLDKIIQQVKHLDQLIDEVSTLSRAEQNRLPYSPQPVDVQMICQEMLDEISVTASDAHVLRLNVQIKKKKAVLDKHLMTLALRNLLSNAVKYSPDGGEIHLSVLEYLEEIHFIVSDSGIGIPLKDQANLFTQFHRASNVGQIRGTGLGLSIVKTVAEQHGGVVAFDSMTGQGSTFIMRLPHHALSAPEG